MRENGGTLRGGTWTKFPLWKESLTVLKTGLGSCVYPEGVWNCSGPWVVDLGDNPEYVFRAGREGGGHMMGEERPKEWKIK